MAMDYAFDRFERAIRAALVEQAGIAADAAELVTPKPNIPADLAFPAFRVARERGLPAPELARQLAATLQFAADSLVGAVSAAGPFLNFSLDPARLAAAVLAESERLG